MTSKLETLRICLQFDDKYDLPPEPTKALLQEIDEAVDEAVAQERERCAERADEYGVEHRCPEGQRIADVLRARASGKDGGGG